MKKLLIASVLKPVSEVRIYERFALSMAKTNKYEINIIGNPTKKKAEHPHIHFHFLPETSRRISNRLRAYLYIIRKSLQVVPQVLIITSPDLLIPGIWIRRRTGCRLVYDIQENYWRNLLDQDVYAPLAKWLLALLIRSMEWLTSVWVDQFFLAEKCYEKELPFIGKKSITLENKTAMPSGFLRQPKAQKNDQLDVIFTGTLSNYSGVMEALDLFQEIKQVKPKAQLHIIGFAPQESFRKHLLARLEMTSGIKVNGMDSFVDHDMILSAIQKANLAIISYPVTKGNRNRIPTKLYEYCALQLPFIVKKDTYWEQVASPSGLAIPIDFQYPNVELILKKSDQKTKKGINKAYTWLSEEGKLLKYIDTLLT
ncbi:MAG: glycosyltransferase [Cyclobacteriaceae bacterium]|nr:glycosyltransferase [Cyclobacteriaceae bacterium HetDA_MAG_MS6]